MLYNFFVRSFFIISAIIFLIPSNARAQAADQVLLSAPLHVVDARTIKHEGKLYTLWGTSHIEQNSSNYKMLRRGQASLQKYIGANAINCFIYSNGRSQCFNIDNNDLAIAMLQEGFLIPDHSDLAGTRYDKTYKEAAKAAQDDRLGLWGQNQPVFDAITGLKSSINHYTIFALVFFTIMSIIFIVIILLNRKSIDRTYLLLDNTLQIITREAKIHKREVELTAVMIHSELKSNLSKIEAYLVIYQDLLATLKDPYADHRYLKAGEVVRSAPALDRYIFDANVDKLDALGEDLIPHVVKLYSYIDSDPPYSNLEPDMDLENAIAIVTSVVENAKQLRDRIAKLIEMCDQKSFVSANLMFSN